jgi:site-specific recombinase XerD
MPSTGAAQSLPDLLASFELACRAQRLAPATIRNYGDGVRSYLAWCDFGGYPPRLDKAQAQAWIVDLLDGGAQAATAHARLKGLRRFTAWLVAEGELQDDPLAGMKPPRVDHKIVQALDEEQLRRLFKACAGTRLYDRRDEAIVRLMAETGCRAGEVVGLTTGDVDLGRGLVTIHKAKGGKARTVPITAQTGLAIDRYLRARRAHGLPDGGALWLGKKGPLGYWGLAGMLKQRAALAGIEGMHAHLLRHTFATRWKAAQGSDDGLMAIAGWTSRSMIDRYAGAAAAARAADEARRLGLGDL